MSATGSEAVTISQLKTCVDEKLSGVAGGGRQSSIAPVLVRIA